MEGEGGVEYEFGNSPSGDGSNGDMSPPRGGGAPGGERVVMMYDDDGNAVPMPMGNFYYDTYNPDDDSSEEDEEDELKRSSDTERSNKPAALSMNGSQSGEESEESYSDEEGDDSDDQFMRIQVAAAPLKSVKTVEQDLEHDKEKPKPKFGGMVRALSSVKMTGAGNSGGGGGDLEKQRMAGAPSNAPATAKEKAAAARAAASKANGGRPGIAAVGRMLSFNKEKKEDSPQPLQKSLAPAASHEAGRSSEQKSELSQGQDRPRLGNSPPASTTTKGQKRHGIAAVGRMLSFKKNKDEKPNASQSQAPSPQVVQASDAANMKDRASHTQEKAANPSVPARAGIAQVGRMMSLSKKKPPQSELAKEEEEGNQFGPNRERRETEQIGSSPGSGARAGLKQVGRMMSISKKPQGQTPSSPASDGKLPDAPQNDRERSGNSGPAPNARKEGSRMGLKAAGRLLSFSRKPPGANKGTSKQSGALGENGAAEAPHVPIRIAPPTSARLDGRANKFFFSEINSTAIANSIALKNQTHIRVPVLALAEYSGPVSKNKWFIDAFTLPHNAVRRECIDLYDILMALARCSPRADVTTDDMKDFKTWWDVADKFIKCYFDMEREVLFPWVNVAGSKDWELQMALGKMRTMKDGLQEQLAMVNKAWETLGTVPAGETFGTLYKEIDSFCPRLMNYFADQELLLPQIVKGYYRIEDRLAMDKEMLASFMGPPLTRKTKDLEHHNLVLLVRWIANPRQLRAWIAKNLNSTGRSSYAKWHSIYEAEHSRVVKTFRNRSRVSTIAAMNQA